MENNNVTANTAPANTAAANMATSNTAPVSADKKCPSCGGTLAFDPVTARLCCKFCGSFVDVTYESTATDLGYTFEELLRITKDSGFMKTTGKSIICSTCGGSFTTMASAISNLCPFCGSNTIAESPVEGGAPEPMGILPFCITKEKASEIRTIWLSKQRFPPKDLMQNARISDITGVYVPYWVFNSYVHSNYSGMFMYSTVRGVQWRQGHGTIDVPVSDMAIIASGNIDKDPPWNKAANFDMRCLVKYDPSLVSGFWAENSTVDGPAVWQRAGIRIRELVSEAAVKQRRALRCGELEMNPVASYTRAKYILAPMWISSFIYNNEVYRIIINGQTGYAEGRFPRSIRRLVTRIILIVGISISIFITLGIILTLLGF